MFKKIIFLVIASVIALSPLYAQSKREVRAIKKEAKAMARQLEEDGFRSVDFCALEPLIENYLFGAIHGHTQVIGIANESVSLNLGKLTAFTNALNEHVSMVSAEVTGRIASNSSTIDGKDREDIIEAFERRVQSEVKSEVRTCLTVVRERKKRYDVRVYCLVDYEAAHAAHMRAMKMALEELELTQEYGEVSSGWLD